MEALIFFRESDLFGSTLPGEYEHYPNDAGLPYDMLAFDYSITKDPSAVSTWQVTMRYRAEIGAAQAFNNPTSPLLEPSEVGYRTARLSMQAEFRDLWRDFASVTALQAVASGDYSVTDIGGSSIDAGRVGVKVWLYKGEILPYKSPNDDRIAREAAMAVGQTSGHSEATLKVVTSAGPRVAEVDEMEITPLVKEADPEFERLLAEEEDIQRRIVDSHETPHFRKED